MANIKEKMSMTKTVDNWYIVKVFIMGAFLGALLATMYFVGIYMIQNVSK